MSVFANDFGEASAVAQGRGDWDEGKYWLDRIRSLSQSQGLDLPVRAGPAQRPHTLGQRKSGHYPGMISNFLNTGAVSFSQPGGVLRQCAS